MKDYERREPKLYDFYKALGIPHLASDRRVMIELDKREKDAISKKNIKEKEFVQLAREYIGRDSQMRKLYDNYLKRHGVKFPLTKREKRIKLIKNSVIGGTIIAVGLTGAILTANHIKKENQENLASNVCVEYTIEEGIGNDDLKDMFREYGYSHYAVSGAERNLSPNRDNPFKGDKVIGRTTEENAEELIESGSAKEVDIDKAIEEFEKLGTLKGEFENYADGNSKVPFKK